MLQSVEGITANIIHVQKGVWPVRMVHVEEREREKERQAILWKVNLSSIISFEVT